MRYLSSPIHTGLEANSPDSEWVHDKYEDNGAHTSSHQWDLLG
jgi:hypothetical protein